MPVILPWSCNVLSCFSLKGIERRCTGQKETNKNWCLRMMCAVYGTILQCKIVAQTAFDTVTWHEHAYHLTSDEPLAHLIIGEGTEISVMSVSVMVSWVQLLFPTSKMEHTRFNPTFCLQVTSTNSFHSTRRIRGWVHSRVWCTPVATGALWTASGASALCGRSATVARHVQL